MTINPGDDLLQTHWTTLSRSKSKDLDSLIAYKLSKKAEVIYDARLFNCTCL